MHLIERERNGMTKRFEYAPLQGRPKIGWPEGKRLAVWLVPNVEHYEIDPSYKGIRDPWPRSMSPDALNYPLKDYGNRVGIDRILDVTDRLGIRCTVSLSLALPTMFPDVFHEMKRREWDFMCHGLYNTHYLWNYPLDEERAFIERCRQGMVEVTGQTRHGWFSPACSHTLNTADLVDAAGFSYYCDLYHDDQPFPVITDSGSLISIPYSMDANDVVVHMNGGEGDDYAKVIIDQFDTLYRESHQNGLVMCIAFHPYVTGQAQRIRAFERALRYVLSHDDVWLATGIEIESWYRTHYLTTVQEWLHKGRSV